MAKLSAFGRVEVLTLVKNEVTPTLKTSRTQLRLMSDGVILSKFDGVFTDGQKMVGVWKKHAKMKNWTTPEVDVDGHKEKVQEFKDYATKRGYTESL